MASVMDSPIYKIVQLPDERLAPYRGVDRWPPFFVDGQSESGPTNQLFLRYVERYGATDLVPDLALARALVAAYAALTPPRLLEIIRVAPVVAPPVASDDFLGFDPCGAFFSLSLIAQNLIGFERAVVNWDRHGPVLAPLAMLMASHFSARLNRYGLFDRFEDADHYARCVAAINAIAPDFYEHPVGEPIVTAVWLIV